MAEAAKVLDKGGREMKIIASLALMICLATSCATNSYNDIGLKPKIVVSVLSQSLLTDPHYQLQFCGVTSRIQRQNNWFYLKMFGNHFEEWVQFAFLDENGSSHRLEFKMIEEKSDTYLSKEGIGQYTLKVTKLMSERFIFSPRLYYPGRTLYKSHWVTLVSMEILPLAYSVIEFENGKNWHMVDQKDYIDAECDGLSSPSL